MRFAGRISVAAFLMYWTDKLAANAGRSRIAENTLHLADLLGGWPGALIAQQAFRHKTAKASFQQAFWATVLLNVVIYAWLARSGLAAELSQAFGR